jgi:hypothetical protein
MVIYCAGLLARLSLFKERTASINQFQIFSHEYYSAAVAKTTDCSPDNITPPDVASRGTIPAWRPNVVSRSRPPF